MGDVRVSATGRFPPERFVAALTDFGPAREQVFGNSQGGYLKVHDQGPAWADVTEGSVRVNVPTPYAPFADGVFPTPSGKCELYSERMLADGLDQADGAVRRRACPNRPRRCNRRGGGR